jgi:hypothetical protein
MRDYNENSQVIQQGVVDPKIQERLNKAENGELRARLAVLLDRGIVSDRLHVDLPDDVHGEWVRNDPLEIRRLGLLGFKIDDTYAKARAIHSDGSDSSIVGDVIFMTCPKETKLMIEDIRLEQTLNAHTKKKIGNKEVQREEIQFLKDVGSSTDGVAAYSSSQEKQASNKDLADILASVDSQTQKFE